MKNGVELNIQVVYESSSWFVIFEKIMGNVKLIAKRCIGTVEPTEKELSEFFEKLNYRELEYHAIYDEALKPQSI
jgi:hypothetical protein